MAFVQISTSRHRGHVNWPVLRRAMKISYRDIPSYYSCKAIYEWAKAALPKPMVLEDCILLDSLSCAIGDNVLYVENSYDILQNIGGVIYSHPLSYINREQERYSRETFGLHHNCYYSESGYEVRIDAHRLENIRNPVGNDKSFVIYWHKDQCNYWHFLFDTLPRLVHLQKIFGEKTKQIKFITIGMQASTTYLDLISAVLGFKPSIIETRGAVQLDRNVIIPPDPAYSMDSKYVESYSDIITSRFTVNEQQARPVPYIYIGRGNAKNGRSLINESELISMLTNYEFVPINCHQLDAKSQVNILANAKTVVAPHGAALANILFMQSGTVIELTSRQYNPINIFLLAAARGLSYFQVRPPVNCVQPRSVTEMRHVDYLCPITQLERVLRPVTRGKIGKT